MKKFRLLLLDANVVIELQRHGIWHNVTKECDVYLARTIVDTEAHFYEDDNGDPQHFDLNENIDEVTVFDIEPQQLGTFLAQFDSSYFDRLDPGEAESLTFLLSSSQECLICSADAIVYRVLGNLKRSEQGVSLEEVLQGIGFGRPLSWKFRKAFREKWTKKGFEEHLHGTGSMR